MTEKTTERSSTDQFSEAIASLLQAGAYTAEAASKTFQNTTENLSAVSESISDEALRMVEGGTENVGKFVTPIAENPLIKYVSKVPGINWLTKALGQVDVDEAQAEVDKLRQEYPSETPDQLAHRIMVDTAMEAGKIGLVTNFLPPLALALFAVDLAAITSLQAEMIYRIAAAYGFSLNDPSRRGEVLGIFGLSVGGSGTIKAGLSIIEIIPGIGALVGASSNAALIYSLGHAANQFYAAKSSALARKNAKVVSV